MRERFRIDAEAGGFFGKQGFDEGGFVVLEFEDAVLDTAAADGLVDDYGFAR